MLFSYKYTIIHIFKQISHSISKESKINKMINHFIKIIIGPATQYSLLL